MWPGWNTDRFSRVLAISAAEMLKRFPTVLSTVIKKTAGKNVSW